ncbi:methionine aminopeptidase, type I [Filifactor alocis ATCC 35896]|jgi:methionine aminopeptidase, type I|uniref:Methionine aminopeptidase n=1 Tax=Filifactor alocis (strain ATCC 35896 / CCUG 47790 / D40 B5) TaxID=546269 RepID=D6GQ50_FILAD|nr:type I methionyl aminopeptidase [Filifactor alocis]EFE28903.1 methionine aminopeptidase, type I [Filifactor alocis ATCC 35896]
MITLRSKREIELLREAGKIVAETHAVLREAVKPGVSTWELDQLAYQTIIKHRAIPSFLNYNGFPGSICASKNEIIVHGIPSKKDILEEGDIISIDIGAFYKGYHGDSAKTHPVGKISKEDEHLIAATRQSFYDGIEHAVIGNRLSDISHHVQKSAEAEGFSVVRDFTGHGVGTKLHEDPPVPNYGVPHKGPRLLEGLVIAVEPMINIGTYRVVIDDDGWTTRTLDGKNSAHYEHTLVITEHGPELLTVL